MIKKALKIIDYTLGRSPADNYVLGHTTCLLKISLFEILQTEYLNCVLRIKENNSPCKYKDCI